MDDHSLERAKVEKTVWEYDNSSLPMGAKIPTSGDREESKAAASGLFEVISFVTAVGLVYFNTWGLLLASGVFQEFLKSEYLSTHSSATVSWIWTTWAALKLLGGAITGPAYDWGFARHLIVIGSAMIVFGMMMFSFSRTYYQAILSQGICVGIGSGMLYIPSLAAVAQSFDKGRSRAIGIASCGASIGGIVYPVMFRRLFPSVGFGWAVRIMAFVSLSTLLVAISILVPRCRSSKTRARHLLDLQALTDIPFLAYCVSGFCILLGYYTLFVYLPTVAIQIGTGSDLVFYLIAITNAGSLVGRSLPTWLADRIGTIYALVAAALCSTVVLFCWPAVHSLVGLVIWSVCWGATSGLVAALPGSVLPDLTPDASQLGTRMGMAWTFCAVGLLLGSPIGEALLDVHGTAWPMQIFAGLAMLIEAGLSLIPAVHLYSTRRARDPGL